jgi:hypothetical protein
VQKLYLPELIGSKVRAEVSRRLKECRNALESLGAERESPEQQSRYLLEVVSKFQRITENALHTNYGSLDSFDEHQSLRLATLVANRNAQFSDEVSNQGHVYCFNAHDRDDDSENDPKTSVTSPPSSVGTQVGEDEDEEKEAYNDINSVPSRKINICHDIEDILHDSIQIEYSKTQGILSWIEGLYIESRGFELGTFSSSILSTVMKKQSAKWPPLAEGYICDIISIVHNFISTALRISCRDDILYSNILSSLMEGLVEKYRESLSMTEFLLKIEREGTPMSQNHYFNSNLQK